MKRCPTCGGPVIEVVVREVVHGFKAPEQMTHRQLGYHVGRSLDSFLRAIYKPAPERKPRQPREPAVHFSFEDDNDGY